MTEHQIVAILKEAEAGIPVKELCRKYGMGNSTFYKWREKYGGMETSISNVYHSVTIAMSCAIVRLSRCAYDYQPKLQDDSVIISMLNTITDRHLRWGLS
jgi:hypothetical protein